MTSKIISRSPAEAVAHSTAYRNNDLPYEKIVGSEVTISDIPTPLVCPTLLGHTTKEPRLVFSLENILDPGTRHIVKKLISRKMFNKWFRIAGGVVVDSILQHNNPKDIDIFYIGGNHDEATKALKWLTDYLASVYELSSCVRYEWLTVFNSKNQRYPEVQVITRLFETPAQCVRGFDIAPSQVYIENVGADGFVKFEYILTESALWSFANLGIVACGELGSKNYEHRLEKYRKKGFSIVMPSLQIGSCGDHRLGFATLKVESINGFAIRGELVADHTQSDYVPSARGRGNSGANAMAVYRALLASATASLNGNCKAAVRMSVLDAFSWRRTPFTVPDEFATAKCAADFVAGVNPRHAHPFVGLFKAFNHPAGLHRKASIIKALVVAAHSLCSDELMQRVVEIGNACAEAGPEEVIGHIGPFIDRWLDVQRAMRELLNRPLWKVEDPGAQHTASVNPRPTSAEEWYGSCFGEPVEIVDDGSARCGTGTGRDLLKFGTTCCICLQEMLADEPVMQLACHHSFHGGCFLRHMKSSAASCPTCRQESGLAVKERRARRNTGEPYLAGPNLYSAAYQRLVPFPMVVTPAGSIDHLEDDLSVDDAELFRDDSSSVTSESSRNSEY
jgi:hypothetical protein